MAVHVVIPARMASTRLPGKPLADIAGIPMIVRVASRASSAQVDSVVVAVDDPTVAEVVEAAGFQAMLTANDHPSGSDRVMEVAQRSGWQDQDIVINVQGDEPLLPAQIINQLAQVMASQPGLSMATLSEPISTATEFFDPNIVKVVTNNNGLALYFSRSPIPFPRDEMTSLPTGDSKPGDAEIQQLSAQRHVGVYAFRVAALSKFVTLTNSSLEQTEKLEQLRWLQAGNSIMVLPSAVPIPGGVDTPEDLERVTRLILNSE